MRCKVFLYIYYFILYLQMYFGECYLGKASKPVNH